MFELAFLIGIVAVVAAGMTVMYYAIPKSFVIIWTGNNPRQLATS